MSRAKNWRELLERGLCPACGKPNPAPWHSLCPACRERERASYHRRKAGITIPRANESPEHIWARLKTELSVDAREDMQ